MPQYFTLYKPFQVLCQFSPSENKTVLADIIDMPKDVYPVGRLDYDSEGLLILTNDASFNQRLLNPKMAHERAYWVQVEGIINEAACEKLRNGVNISIKGKNYRTKKCKAGLIKTPTVPERNPPIRFRKNVPDSWLQLILTEGKNRQVRKMTAAVGFPTLRLIRQCIENIRLNDMQPGELRQWQRDEIYKLLMLN